VDETASGYSGVFRITSRHMRNMLARFPELMLVDCTHMTNRLVMRLSMYCSSIVCVLTIAWDLLLNRYNYQLCPCRKARVDDACPLGWIAVLCVRWWLRPLKIDRSQNRIAWARSQGRKGVGPR
jgi:hypothetical protein